MKVVSVVGARPQFVKLAPISRVLRQQGTDHVVIHTGQHYDANMSDSFFSDFALPPPDLNLGVGSGLHGQQTGAMLTLLETEFLRIDPDWVLVYGDTNSTIAAALAAAKLDVSIAHLEAGLRSFNRSMPEEHNRVLTDHASDLLLSPTDASMTNLANEGLANRSVLVGDVMADICLDVAEHVKESPPTDADKPTEPFILATLHRPYNTDSPKRLRRVIAALASLPLPVVLPAHPRLVHLAAINGIKLDGGSIRVTAPLSYHNLIYLASNARAIVTDSGGLQKEAFLLGVPCTTIRTETEWIETLNDEWNVLTFDDIEGLPGVCLRPIPAVPRGAPFGTGHAAEKVAQALAEWPG